MVKIPILPLTLTETASPKGPYPGVFFYGIFMPSDLPIFTKAVLTVFTTMWLTSTGWVIKTVNENQLAITRYGERMETQVEAMHNLQAAINNAMNKALLNESEFRHELRELKSKQREINERVIRLEAKIDDLKND